VARNLAKHAGATLESAQPVLSALFLHHLPSRIHSGLAGFLVAGVASCFLEMVWFIRLFE